MTTTTMQRTNGTNGGGRNSLKTYLEDPAVRAKLSQVASSHMKADDLVRLALMAASRQPEIAKCAQHSILRALMDAAALGIKPGGLMGRGYLVPRMNRATKELECSFDPGWRGLIDIARRTGQIKRIEAHVVYESDHFEVKRDPLTTVTHVPSEESDPGPVRAAYAVAEFRDGEIQIEVLFRRDLDKIRKTSAAQGGPWASWYEEMARKSAVRRLCKYLPYDPLLERALEAATEAEADEPMARDVVGALSDKPPQAKRLASKISARNADAQQGPSPMPSEQPAESASESTDGGAEAGSASADESDRGDDPNAY